MKASGSRAAIISVLLVGIVIFVGAFYSWNTIFDILQPVSTTQARNIPFTIQPGESTSQIADNLQQKGLIRNATAFKVWVKLHGQSSLEAGVYDHLNPSMTISEIIDQLQKGEPDEIVVRVIEGSRLEEIANAAASAGLPQFNKADFLKYTKNASTFPDRNKYPSLFKNVPANASMEGLLFPDTYYLTTGSTAVDLIDKMLDEMQSQIKANKIDTYAQQHDLTLYQVLTLASIVQRESGKTDDPGKIARVYLNRLYTDDGIKETGGGKMQADPTVQYARDSETNPTTYWKPLDDEGDKIATDSKWNTYIVTGMPPTPICSPGLKSLTASANPPQWDYLYFYTDQHMVTHYEKTLDQFEQDQKTNPPSN